MARPLAKPMLLLIRCSAYLLGSMVKLLDGAAAAGETAALGLLLGSILTAACLAGFTRVAALLANRFWDIPAGPVRF